MRKSGKIKDGNHNLLESATLVDLPYQPLQEGTVFEATSGSEINQCETGKLEKTGEDMNLAPLAYLTSKQSNASIIVPTSGEASFSSCMTDSTFIDCLDISSYVTEEINPTEHCEGEFFENMTVKIDTPCDPSASEDGTLPGKAPAVFFYDSPLALKDDGRGRPLEVVEPNTNIYQITVRESQDMSNELEIVMLSGDLATKISSNYSEDSDEVNKRLDSSLQFSADTGGAEKIISVDESNTFQMPEPLQEQAESSVLGISTVDEESLHDSTEGNENDSVDQLSPKKSSFSLETVSSILQSESLNNEVKNISMSQEERPHPQSPGSSRKIDVVEYEPTVSPSIAYELEHSSDAEEAQESAVIDMVEPLLSGCREDPNAFHVNPNVFELIKTNGKTHVSDSLEFVDVSTKLSVQYDELLLEGSTKVIDLNAGKVIASDGLHGQVLCMLQSAKVSSFDVYLQKDLILEVDTSCQPNPDIEELAIRRKSAFLLSQDKPFMPFEQNEDLEMLNHAASRVWPSAQNLSNSFDDKPADVNVDDIHVELNPSLEGDNICSRENNQDSDSKYENVISEDGTTVKVYSLLQSSKANSFDILTYPFSDVASLNRHKSESDKPENADSDSKPENKITGDGIHGEFLTLLQSLNVSSLDAQLLEDHVSEDSSLNQRKQEAEEPGISSDLTCLQFKRKLFVPLSKNRGQDEFVYSSSSSQLFALDLSDFTDSGLTDDNLIKVYDRTYEENLACSRKDDQDFDSEVSVQHFLVDAGRSEVQHQQNSVFQAVEEPITLHIKTGGVNIDPSDIHFDEVCFDQPIDSQNNLERELETLCDHGCNGNLNVPLSRIDGTEKTDSDLFDPFQDINKYPGCSIACVALTSGAPLVADFIIPNPSISAQEPFEELTDEMISRFQIQDDNEETPPLPPLPPLQWRMVKPHLESLVADEHIAQPVEKNKPCILPLNAGKQITNSFLAKSSPKVRFEHVSSSTDGMVQSVKLSELPLIAMDERQKLDIRSPEVKTVHSSDLSWIMSSEEDGKHTDGNIAVDGKNKFTIPSLKDLMPQHPDLLEAGNLEETRKKLVKFHPGLEYERLQEAPVIDRDAVTPLNSFPVMSTTRDGNCQYIYGDYGGYEGEGIQHHNFSGPFPIAAHNIPHYGYHMFVMDGNSYNAYDIISPNMESDKPNEMYSIRNRPRDHLIEAVAAHDKSTMRKVSELGWPLTKPLEDERNYLLEQIKNKSFNLRPATSAKPNILKAHPTNLKVVSILEKANTIRQACVGSDEDDDNWSDS